MGIVVQSGVLSQRREFANKDGSVRFSAGIFAGRNYSLAGLYSQQDTLKQRGLCADLRDTLMGMGARRAYAPTPAKNFNGLVGSPNALTTKIALCRELNIWRNREKQVDGTFLRQLGDAGIISAGGCPTIVATYRNQCIFAHAGRDCLMDREWIDSGFKVRGRPHESVVDSIVEAFKTSEPFRPGDMEAWVLWAIRPEDFYDDLNHPKWGKRNKKTFDYVRERFGKGAFERDGDLVGYDLPVMIGTLFAKHGVLAINDDDAYLPEGFPTTRTEGQGDIRYLTAVVRQL